MKDFIKNHPALFNAAFFARNIGRELRSFAAPAPGPFSNTAHAFHGDVRWRSVVDVLLRDLPVSSVVETGTYQGATTAYFAERFPKTIYTCELIGLYYRESNAFLKRFSNVAVRNESSSDFVRGLVAGKAIGDLPLFFLDAHWYRYWPLHDELAAIGQLPQAIVMIDDFKVPGRPWFGYDIQHNADGTKIDEDLAMIGFWLDPSKHRVLLPKYGRQGDDLRGHVIVFQGAEKEFSRAISDAAIKENYEEYRIGK